MTILVLIGCLLCLALAASVIYVGVVMADTFRESSTKGGRS